MSTIHHQLLTHNNVYRGQASLSTARLASDIVVRGLSHHRGRDPRPPLATRMTNLLFNYWSLLLIKYISVFVVLCFVAASSVYKSFSGLGSVT